MRALCERLGVPLRVERVRLGEPSGNLQERARDARYALAERLAEGDYAAAHTASDQAETVLYRLAVSPGSRALHGMAPRRGRLVRPLLGVTRDEVRDYLRERGLEWREDPSNADRRFARARVRHDLLDALRSIGPGGRADDRGDRAAAARGGAVLDAAVDAALRRARRRAGGVGVGARRRRRRVRRLVLRRLAEQAGGELGARRGGARSWRSADAARSRSTSAAGCARSSSTARSASRARASRRAPEPVALPVPGSARFGDWEVEAGAGAAGRRERGAGSAPPLTGARLARRRPHAPASAWAARRRSRTCSPTARCRARCAARCRWSRAAARSSGWPGSRSTSASRPPRATRGRLTRGPERARCAWRQREFSGTR